MTTNIEDPWFGEIVRKLERVEPPAKLASFLDVDACPEWVIKVSGELFQQSVPSAPLAKFKVDTSNSTGLWLGQSAANFYAIGESLQGNLALVEKDPEKVKAFQVQLADDAAKPDVQNLLCVAATAGHLLEGLEKHCSELQKLILRAFKPYFYELRADTVKDVFHEIRDALRDAVQSLHAVLPENRGNTAGSLNLIKTALMQRKLGRNVRATIKAAVSVKDLLQ